ncbi:uncharacterized protein LOC115883775 [Sitophilus oryzae]|uniref:Uncharacterized protein LOC115883775 n=1 Tax=Sitophilus oryzae TaxID=7048 RepID=A0A6J2Y428_SITOR|nr:uncharacterized protein LOC115883775 [Sitophilus oryzae]
MESVFRIPEPLNFDGVLADNWRRFKQRFDLYSEATDLPQKGNKKQVAIFLNLIGEEGLELFNSFSLTDAETEDLKKVVEKFEEYCSPRKNIIFERYRFNSIIQNDGQSFDSFLTELRKAVKTTEYGEPEQMIRDRIVIGVSNKLTQERLLRESDLTLETAIKICRAVEISKSQSKALQNEASVSAVTTKDKVKRSQSEKQIMCSYCGYNHDRGKCPAFGKKCTKCKGKNHFAAVCKKKEKDTNKNRKKKSMKSQEMWTCQKVQKRVSSI